MYAVPASFNVVMVNQDFVMVSNPGMDKEPYGDYSFELDLSYSNSWDQLRRSLDVSIEQMLWIRKKADLIIKSRLRVRFKNALNTHTHTHTHTHTLPLTHTYL